MKTLEEIREILTGQKAFLRQKYEVKEIGIFGSYVKKKQKKRIDLDILVEFDDSISLLEFIRLENYLSEILGIKVDLVMKIP